MFSDYGRTLQRDIDRVTPSSDPNDKLRINDFAIKYKMSPLFTVRQNMYLGDEHRVPLSSTGPFACTPTIGEVVKIVVLTKRLGYAAI